MPFVPGSGYPQTSSNRTRSAASSEIASYTGGEDDAAATARAGKCWDAAVREFNSVPWKFNLLTQDISLTSSMLDNTTAPSVSRDAGAGNGIVLTTGTAITYWVEERVKSGSIILKRNTCPSSKTITLAGDGTTDRPVVTRPATVNVDATHWALFGTKAGGAFPDGAMIAEVDIATTTIEDTRTGNNPALADGDLYYVSRYLLATSTRGPKSAWIIDDAGHEAYNISWLDFAEFTRWYASDLAATATSPEVYTLRNLHETGEVIVSPRQNRPSQYPTLRLTYFKRIDIAAGANDVIDAPLEVEEAIFNLAVAKYLAKSRMFTEAIAAYQLARELRKDVAWDPIHGRDYFDFEIR